MNRLICLLLCLMMASPVFAAGPKMYPESEVDALLQDAIDKGDKLKEMTEAYKGCVKKNSELSEKYGYLLDRASIAEIEKAKLQVEIKQLKAEDEALSNPARYISLGLGVWGVVTFATTGGVYPLVTGVLFIRGAMR